ncbi:retrotransposon protein, putative, ty1-copia subclass, partial [Tanacetum coccineum]
NGLWFIRNNPLILKKWHPDVNLLKEDVSTVPVWVKLHGVPVKAFGEDGLSAIATKLCTPLMFDSYTSDMCLQSWGRSSYAKAMIELCADMELKDNIVVAMPKITREGHYKCGGETKNLKKTSQAPKGVDSTNKVSNSNPFEVLNSVDNDVEMVIDGQAILVDEADNPLKKVEYPDDHDSEDEVASVDNDMARNLASERTGFGTQSLLEQWRDSYGNGDYDEDPYDDDMYEGQDLSEEIQSICDKMDIRV